MFIAHCLMLLWGGFVNMKTCDKSKQRGDRFRTFDGFWNDLTKEHPESPTYLEKLAVKEAWNYQQKYIDLLEKKLKNFRKSV